MPSRHRAKYPILKNPSLFLSHKSLPIFDVKLPRCLGFEHAHPMKLWLHSVYSQRTFFSSRFQRYLSWNIICLLFKLMKSFGVSFLCAAIIFMLNPLSQAEVVRLDQNSNFNHTGIWLFYPKKLKK